MHFDVSKIPPRESYKLLVSTVIPRPIALVTTISPTGVINAAPFSFYNAMGHNPPVVALGIEARPDGSHKDTSFNIRANNEFVINIVDDKIAELMNLCSRNLTPEESEIEHAGLTTIDSVEIKPPRIVEAPVSMECVKIATLELKRGRQIVIGEVQHFHIRDDIVIDPDHFYLDVNKIAPISRLNASRYCKITDQFEMPRMPLTD